MLRKNLVTSSNHDKENETKCKKGKLLNRMAILKKVRSNSNLIYNKSIEVK